jgi:hypothetical protein
MRFKTTQSVHKILLISLRMLRFVLFSLLCVGILGDVWGPANFTLISDSLVHIGNYSDSQNFSDFTPHNDSSLLDGHYTLGEFLSSIFTSSNTSWTFVSVITVYPPVCNALDNIIAEFNDALAEANPEADDIRSVPRRLGGSKCSGGGCPCAEGRRDLYRTRSLEIETRSKTKRLNVPKRLRSYPWFYK